MAELEKRIEELKIERKNKKNELKDGTKDFSEDMEELKYKINLGKKCLIVLNYDLNEFSNNSMKIEAEM